MPPILYHFGTSVCAARVRLVLAEKGADWESRVVDTAAGAHRTPEFLALNPKASLPVLVAGELVLTESGVICEYLDEALPGPRLMPGAAADRARTRAWMRCAEEDLHPACTALTLGAVPDPAAREAASVRAYMAIAGPSGRARLSRRLRWAEGGVAHPDTADTIAVYGEILDRMEAALAARPHLAGAVPGMADFAVAPFLFRLVSLGLAAAWEEGRRPRVAAWVAGMRARPAFRAAVEDWIDAAAAARMRAAGDAARAGVLPLLTG